jgi:hypothetical protein
MIFYYAFQARLRTFLALRIDRARAEFTGAHRKNDDETRNREEDAMGIGRCAHDAADHQQRQ